MELENNILTCIKEHPGMSARRVVACLGSKSDGLTGTEETKPQASIFKQLRTLRKRGHLHNQGDRWYVLKGKIG